MKPLCLLLIEDDADYASLVLAWLSASTDKQTFSVQWTDSLAAALSRLQQGGIDLILMDLGLPDSKGVPTFNAVQSQAKDIPIVILTSSDEDVTAVQTIQKGAQDYLSKPDCTGQSLARTLRHAVLRHRSAPAKSESEAERRRSKLVAVVGASGGVGTTTIASVLAAELRQQTGAKTLLVDLDLGPGLAAFSTGVEPQFSVGDALGQLRGMDEAMWDSLVTPSVEGVDVLGATRGVVPAQYQIPDVRDLLILAARVYHWVVLDLGRINYFSMEALRWTDECVLAASSDLQSLHQCKQVLEIFEASELDRKRLRLLVNQKDKSTALSPAMIRRAFGIDVDCVLPPSYEELYRACLRKQLPSPKSAFRSGLATFARDMAEIPEGKETKQSAGFGGMMRRLVDANAR